MIRLVSLALTIPAMLAAQNADTLRLDVGSREVDGRIYAPHAARVRVYVGSGAEQRMRAEWVNVLTHGDSAGRKVHRWVTTGTQIPLVGEPVRWELRQTYDARTLAPYGIARTASTGASSSFRIDGNKVTGTRRASDSTAPVDVSYTLERPASWRQRPISFRSRLVSPPARS